MHPQARTEHFLPVEDIVCAQEKQLRLRFSRGPGHIYRSHAVDLMGSLRIFLTSINVGKSRSQDRPFGTATSEQSAQLLGIAHVSIVRAGASDFIAAPLVQQDSS